MSSAPYSPALIVASSIPSSISLNDLVRSIRYQQGIPLSGDSERPYAVLRQSVAQSIPNNALTPILMDSEDIDTAAGHSTTSNTARWTCPSGEAGWYSAAGVYVAAGTSTSGGRLACLLVDNATRYGQASTTGNPGLAGGSEIAVCISDRFYLAVGDNVQLCAYQNSGGSLATSLTAMASRLTISKERFQ